MSTPSSIESSNVTTKVFVGSLVLFMTIGALALFFLSPTTDSIPEGGQGIEFPEADLVDLRTGREFRFEEFLGRPVVLNLFGSWCPNCISEMPEFEEAHLFYEDDVVFIGLAVNDPVEASTELVERTGVTYLTATDVDRFMTVQIEPQGFPHTLLIDETGLIVAEQTGEINFDILTATIDSFVPEVARG